MSENEKSKSAYNYGRDSGYTDGFVDGYKAGVKAAKPKWTPVSERQPEKPEANCDYYFSAVRREDVKADEYIVMIDGATIPTALYWDGSVWFDPYEKDPQTYDVIAWMELPKSYEEGKE